MVERIEELAKYARKQDEIRFLKSQKINQEGEKEIKRLQKSTISNPPRDPLGAIIELLGSNFTIQTKIRVDFTTVAFDEKRYDVIGIGVIKRDGIASIRESAIFSALTFEKALRNIQGDFFAEGLAPLPWKGKNKLISTIGSNKLAIAGGDFRSILVEYAKRISTNISRKILKQDIDKMIADLSKKRKYFIKCQFKISWQLIETYTKEFPQPNGKVIKKKAERKKVIPGLSPREETFGEKFL